MNNKDIIVMGFGTFDIVHPGHISYFNQLKELGNTLIIVIARDLNVKSFKGKVPLNNENKRLKDVSDCKIADIVILGDHNDCYKVIRDYKPNIIGLGYDQRANTEELSTLFPDVQIKVLKPFNEDVFKSSKIKIINTQIPNSKSRIRRGGQ